MDKKRILPWLLLAFIFLLPLIATVFDKYYSSGESTVVSGEVYSIVEFSDCYFLKMHDDQPVLEYVIKDLDNDPYVAFSTIAKMRNAIRSQSFDDAELTKIQQFTADPARGIILFDPTKIYTPVFPEPLESIGVRWHGDYYVVELEADGTGIAPFNDTRNGRSYSCRPTITFLDQSNYEQQFQDNYETLLASNETLESSTKNPARNATIYYIHSSQGRQKIIHYTITDGDKTLHIEENYILSWWYDSDLVSSTVPHNVSIYCEQGDARFIVTVSNLAERPSLEWLSAFGVDETVLSVLSVLDS